MPFEESCRAEKSWGDGKGDEDCVCLKGLCFVLVRFYGARNCIRSYERQGVNVNREALEGIRLTLLTSLASTAQSLLRLSRHPGNSRSQESDKHTKEVEEK